MCGLGTVSPTRGAVSFLQARDSSLLRKYKLILRLKARNDWLPLKSLLFKILISLKVNGFYLENGESMVSINTFTGSFLLTSSVVLSLNRFNPSMMSYVVHPERVPRRAPRDLDPREHADVLQTCEAGDRFLEAVMFSTY